MAITKLSNIGTPQGGGAAHLKNCISYILNSDKTENGKKKMEGKAIISLSHFHREKRQKKKHMR